MKKKIQSVIVFLPKTHNTIEHLMKKITDLGNYHNKKMLMDKAEKLVDYTPSVKKMHG